MCSSKRMQNYLKYANGNDFENINFNIENNRSLNILNNSNDRNNQISINVSLI